MKSPRLRRRREGSRARKSQSRRQHGLRLHRIEPLEHRRLLSVSPTLEAIPDVTVYAGAPLNVALDGYDEDFDALDYSVQITASDLSGGALTTYIPEGNQSLRISMEPHPEIPAGDMIIELFEGRAPETTSMIISLAEDNFYDELTFHRVIEGFVIQGGDPDGDGTGGPGFEFDDEFHRELLHTSTGVLSMAKSFDDTNGSQFFITAGPTRHLDGNHSVFGFLTEGDEVRDAINSVETDANNMPTTPVVMSSVTVFEDLENGVLMLSAPDGTTGWADVTVTVDDGQGGTAQETFRVTVQPDSVANNTGPILSIMEPIRVPAGGSSSFTVVGSDLEGDAMYYGAWNLADWPGYVDWNTMQDPELGVSVNSASGVGTVTLTDGQYGVHGILVGVTSSPQAISDYNDLAGASSNWDFQFVPVYATPAVPTSIELLPEDDTGTVGDGVTSHHNTLATELAFQVNGVTPGVEVRLYVDGQEIGSTFASGSSVVVSTDSDYGALAEGPHAFEARQVGPNAQVTVGNLDETVSLLSDASPSQLVVIDLTPPEFTSTPVTIAVEGAVYSYDAQTDDEDAGRFVAYDLTTLPAGMSIDQSTGEITWVPSAGQTSDESVVVKATDGAGNDSSHAFVIEMGDLPVIDPIDPQVADVPVLLTVTITATDPDLPLVFSLDEGAPLGATIEYVSDTSAEFQWMPRRMHQSSDHSITVRATDATGLSSTETFTVTVNEAPDVNDPPWVETIEDVVLQAGAPLHVPLTGYDGDDDALTYTVTDSGGVDLTASIPLGNPSLKITIADGHPTVPAGEMVFELFQAQAQYTTDRILALVDEGSYNGSTFSRVSDEFIQGGDPQGSGTTFDDEFHPDLQHTSAGLLSLVAGLDDANDSQFIITNGPMRERDFDNVVFGRLVSGDEIRQAIHDVELNGSQPADPVIMESVTRITDQTNGVLTLSAPAGTTGETDVTVTVVDGQGGVDTKTFHVTVVPDTENARPYLSVTPPQLATTGNEPVSFTLTGIDADQAENGDELWYGAWNMAQWDTPAYQPNLEVEIDPQTGECTVWAPTGDAGVLGILVGVNSHSIDEFDYLSADPRSFPPVHLADWDFQFIPLHVTPGSPTAIELLSDTGIDDSDLLTNLNNTAGKALQFRVHGVAVGATVTLYAEGRDIGTGVASDHTIDITTHSSLRLEDGPHSITARQSMLGQEQNVGNGGGDPINLLGQESGDLLEITVDTLAPTFSTSPVTDAAVGEAYLYDADTDAEAAEGVIYSLIVSPSGMEVDPNTGLITWTPTLWQTSETVRLEAMDAAGNTTEQTFTIVAAQNETLDFIELLGYDAVDGNTFPFRPARSGRLVAEAFFDQNLGDIDLRLLDSAGLPVADSQMGTDYERIDHYVTTTETYELQIVGNHPDVDYRLSILLTTDGDELTLHGTEGDDTFEVAIGEPGHQVSVNGVTYPWLTLADYRVIHINGLGGNDTLSASTTAADDFAVLAPSSMGLLGGGYQIDALGVETVTLDGGGGHDEVHLVGTPGDDTLIARPGDVTLYLGGDDFQSRVMHFESVYVDASLGGVNVAKLYDSAGDDELVATASYGRIAGPDWLCEAQGFAEIRGYATAGGHDTATLFDTAGDDALEAHPDRVSLIGDGYYRYMQSFEEVSVYGTAGGHNTAIMYDTPGDDTLWASPTLAKLSGDGYSNLAQNFASVEVVGSTGYDKADLFDSGGNDTFHATPHGAKLYGEGFYNQVTGFLSVAGHAGNGGFDMAKLFDSEDDDLLIARPHEARLSPLSGLGFQLVAKDFDQVHAYAEKGGVDVVKLHDSDGDDVFEGRPGESVLSGDGFYNRVKYFENVNTYALNGGNDTADMYGSDQDDTLDANLEESELYGSDYLLRAWHFETVRVHAGAGGNDVASLWDSDQSDTLMATPTSVSLFNPEFFCQADGFPTVSVFSRYHSDPEGPQDSAELHDTAGDDTFVAHPGTASMYGDGIEQRVFGFEKIEAHADAGGFDIAKLNSSDKDSTLIAGPDETSLSGEGFSNQALGFDRIQAYGGDGVNFASMYDSPGNDEFIGKPGESTLRGDGFCYVVKDFESTHGYADQGGNDSAVLHDSPGNNVLVAWPTSVTMYDGSAVISRAVGFSNVHAYSDAGGWDIAKLHDSSDTDEFSATPTLGTLSGPAFENKAENFDQVYAYSEAGGDDVAKLYDSPGDDIFEGRPELSWLHGTGFRNEARQFTEVRGISENGGNDVAKLGDSNKDDTFTSTYDDGKTTATMSGSGRSQSAEGFPEVHAYATRGGYNTAELHGSPNDDLFVATPEQGELYDASTYYVRAKYFEKVEAFSDNGGHDVAELYDAAGNDTFIARPDDSYFSNRPLPGDAVPDVIFENRALYFEEVHAFADAGGFDVAKFHDSPGDDVFDANPEEGVLSGSLYSNRAVHFEEVQAFATDTGFDVANLSGSAGDDLFTATSIDATLSGANFYHRVKHFDEVYADGAGGAADRAELYGSEGDDLLEGDQNWARLSDMALSFLHEVTDFDDVRVSAMPQGRTQDPDSHDKEGIDEAMIDYLLTLDGIWEEL